MARVARDGRRLRVDLEVDPSDDWDCPIVSETPDATDVAVNAVGHDCTVDVQPADGEGLVRARGEVSEDCLCRIFQGFGCVPHVRRVEDGTMLVTAYVDDRDTVRDVVGALRETLDRVRLVRLAVVEGPEATERVTFDLSALTPKQREGLELAVVRGYFDGDRDVRLGELAADLDISKSALSQRLRAAQAKIVTDAFDGDGE
ncbi:helix-turn-helix domain-containing protein [Halorubrum lipolyticum]|uniref:Bacterio-opsin activator HTH domain protein n=1 Tax=Halorubrum lipolyticum DSM 21995 TaxID=1227482 RepID=M0NN63_9EURY|nr:helix-turn-helix domain-containing protein [Halorubrum lipolyticum]EMA59246.1 Bacterio-opsin activator HTH domain protein [Halorubrum lipolyticum DSM 21995]